MTTIDLLYDVAHVLQLHWCYRNIIIIIMRIKSIIPHIVILFIITIILIK